jgi:hypothetical protein
MFLGGMGPSDNSLPNQIMCTYHPLGLHSSKLVSVACPVGPKCEPILQNRETQHVNIVFMGLGFRVMYVWTF